jgi:glycosyltransferase involved in cell wall biosynthesis
MESLRYERDGYYGELQHALNQLAEIHGSKMWRFWMWSIAVRRLAWRVIGLPLRALESLGRAAFWVLCLPWLMVRLSMRTPQALGWLYLRLSVPIRFLTRRRSMALPIPAQAEPDNRPEGRRPRVLIVSPYHIWPPNHGGGARLFNLVRGVHRDVDLHLLIFSRAECDDEQRDALTPYCSSVTFHRWHPRECPDMFRQVPSGAQLFSSDEARRTLQDIVHIHGIDVVQLEYTELGQYAAALPPGVKVILTEHDIAFRSHRRRRAMRFHRRFPEGNAFGESHSNWRRLVDYEIRWAKRADRVHCMSEDDAQYLAGFIPSRADRFRVVANGVDTSGYQPGRDFSQRRGVLYVGNFQNLPNVDALEYLVGDIWPLVRLKDPEATLTVVGANMSERIQRHHGRDGINVVGMVPSLEPYYREHRVLAAPIRAGSGTRLKIMEAFASGLPVVSTSLGAEGIRCTDGHDIAIADRATPFARELLRLLHDDRAAEDMSGAGRRLAESTYSWDTISRTLVADWRELAAEEGEERRPGVIDQAGSIPSEADPGIDVTIVIPTYRGGAQLERTLEAVSEQTTDLEYEVLCIDSESPAEDVAMMRRLGARVVGIQQRWFNHGLTRDVGAAAARGRILVYINQDATPASVDWLEGMVRPLLKDDPTFAAVQGGILEFPPPHPRFFWDSCGDRFYFTREAPHWAEHHHTLGFSTVNCAIRASVLRSIPFGEAEIMEDKKWQREVARRLLRIEHHPHAAVHHTHVYTTRGLIRRCYSEGYGWKLLGLRYEWRLFLGDLVQPGRLWEAIRAIPSGRVSSFAELFFPVIRPLAVFAGNRFGSKVLH